ncbi:MAG: hypothetical protein LBG21_01770 [Campylobacteraceae bacterium]|nr:hypothetical protein [Campylobacteraceae bacterium]
MKSYLQNGAAVEFQYKNDRAVSCVCTGVIRKRTPLTGPEIIYWNNGERITCE